MAPSKGSIDLRTCEGRIAFRDGGGSGRPIVLLHGGNASSAVWSHLFGSALAARWRLLAFDLPGCGDSARLESYSIASLCEVIAAFGREMGCEDALFVGHSLGGHLLLEAVAQLPRARGFAILGTPPLRNPPDVQRAFQAAPALGLAMKPDLTDGDVTTLLDVIAGPEHPARSNLEALLRRTDPRLRDGLGASLAAGHHRDEVEVVRTITKPVAVLHGAQDALVSRAYLESLPIPTLWRGAIQVIPGAGHYAQIDSPGACARLLLEFAEDVERGSS